MLDQPPFEGPLSVVFVAVFPVPTSYSGARKQRCLAGLERPTKKPDDDNMLKCLDALNQVVWRDDVQRVDTRIIKIYGERPRTAVIVEEIDLGAIVKTSRADQHPVVDLFSGARA